MSSFPARLAKKIGSIGLSRASGAIYEVARNKILHLIYGFDPWHITGTFHARPYKADVVRLCESVPHDCVVEIGVGLGDILGRVHAVKEWVLIASRWFFEPQNIASMDLFHSRLLILQSPMS